MRYFSLVIYIFIISCSSSKKVSTDALVKDSDFLKNGQVIEVFNPKKAEVKSVSSQSNDKKVTEKTSLKKTSNNLKSSEKKTIKKVDNPKASKITKIENNETWKFPFIPGEKVVLSAKYFGVEAGKITLGMFENKKVNGKKAAHFYAEGQSSRLFSMVYRIKDKVESLWDPIKKRPFLIAFHIDEAKQKREIRTHFKWKEGISTTVEEGWKKKKGDYTKNSKMKIPGQGQDIMSAFFYMRTLPLKVGKTYSFNVFEEDKLVRASLFVEKKDVLSTRMGKFNTLILSPNFEVEGKFKKVGDIKVWITDDKYRQIVRIESKIKIGTVVAKLYSLTRP